MTWATLKDVRHTTMLDFTRELAEKHHFVRTPSGRWSRTLGPPGLNDLDDGRHELKCVSARVWHMDVARDSPLNQQF